MGQMFHGSWLAGNRGRPAHASTQNSISNVHRVNDALKVAGLGKQQLFYSYRVFQHAEVTRVGVFQTQHVPQMRTWKALLLYVGFPTNLKR